nr:reverse transcriptase [Tanacetum cinerariifolium]
PSGFVDSRYPNHVCLLQRSLYGLKQAPRAWFQRFAGYATRAGFSPSSSPVLLQQIVDSMLAVLKPERLKADRARRLLISVLLFTVCEKASKVESCPSEIILDGLLALDSIDSQVAYLLIYMDDIILTASSPVLLSQIIDWFRSCASRSQTGASQSRQSTDEIILDGLLALDSIVHFDLGDRRLEQTATFSISTNSE